MGVTIAYWSRLMGTLFWKCGPASQFNVIPEKGKEEERRKSDDALFAKVLRTKLRRFQQSRMTLFTPLSSLGRRRKKKGGEGGGEGRVEGMNRPWGLVISRYYRRTHVRAERPEYLGTT